MEINWIYNGILFSMVIVSGLWAEWRKGNRTALEETN